MVIATDDYASIARTLRCFRSQGDPARLEIVIAAMGGAVLGRDAAELAGFPHVRVVDAGAGIDIGRAEALAIDAATAPFVVFAEGCAFPSPGFVDAIAAACGAGRGDVIGPAMRNANPDSATSWAAMQINYGRWLDDPQRGEWPDVPGHNSAYRRAAMASLGDDLDDVMPSLTAVQHALRARGGLIYLEPSACVEILNVSRPGWYLIDQFGKGRQFATHRRRCWSLVRRLGHVGAAPVIPLVRLGRILAALHRKGRASEVWQGARFALMAAGLVTSAAGECVGYVVGWRASRGFFERSLHRPRFVRPEDRPPDDDQRQ